MIREPKALQDTANMFNLQWDRSKLFVGQCSKRIRISSVDESLESGALPPASTTLQAAVEGY
jgi:hypothetical protein